MEPSNVNNLNGIPNFGHGSPEAEATETPVEEVEESTDEESDEESEEAETLS